MIQNNDWQLFSTEDGSLTLTNKNLEENYHSTHGARAESMHVYIENGYLAVAKTTPLKILEVGFGTGLNCLLTYLNQHKETTIHYTALEPFPIQQALLEPIIASQPLPAEIEILSRMHQADWSITTAISTHFLLEKRQLTFQAYSTQNQFDVIYYDAFGAHIQPEMWDEESCTKMFELLRPNGFVITYCAKGSFKRNLKKAGFMVVGLPGPKGKREITKAIKPPLA